jgi:hypothetical protein
MTHREATGADTAYGFQAAPQAPVRCVSEQDRRKSHSWRVPLGLSDRGLTIFEDAPGRRIKNDLPARHERTPLRDDIKPWSCLDGCLSVASRRPIMKKQIGSPIPTCFMNADFLGAEPQPDRQLPDDCFTLPQRVRHREVARLTFCRGEFQGLSSLL